MIILWWRFFFFFKKKGGGGGEKDTAGVGRQSFHMTKISTEFALWSYSKPQVQEGKLKDYLKPTINMQIKSNNF